MGFSFFGSNADLSSDPSDLWIKLSTLDGLEKIVSDSNTNPQIIFKHSTRCIISRISLNNFEEDWKSENEKVSLHLLDLLQFREVSNKISLLLGVHHQSPQLIVLDKGEVMLHRSHQSIDAKEVNSLLKG